MTKFAVSPKPYSLGSSNLPGAASFATSIPSVVLPVLPVSLPPICGSTMVLVCTRFVRPGVRKISCPSRKNGRSSGKNSGYRWFVSICGRSASIWEKSGLRVKSAVRFDVTPYFMLNPKSGWVSPSA